MPIGSRGERRPAAVVGAAIMIAKIATGGISESVRSRSGRTRSDRAGAVARIKKSSAEESSTDRKEDGGATMGITLPVVKKSKAQKSKSASPQSGVMNINSVRLEPIESAAVFYVNYIEVGNSPQDFSLWCGRMPSKLTPAKIEEIESIGALVIEPDVQLIIPTTLVPGLIKALITAKENYEKLFGVQLKEVGARHD
jgi:hypothetical protein